MNRGPLKGFQYVSFAQLARDVRNWTTELVNVYSAVVGLPRSGLTCAHMVSSLLNIPCLPIEGGTVWRQSTGRTLDMRESGKILVVDDACSYGTAMTEARRLCEQAGIDAEFAAIYSRGSARHLLDHSPYVHEEPDHLVVFEWNWMYHQDRGYIAVTKQCQDHGLRSLEGFAGVFDERDPKITKKIEDSNAVMVFAAEKSRWIDGKISQPVVDIRTGDTLGLGCVSRRHRRIL